MTSLRPCSPQLAVLFAFIFLLIPLSATAQTFTLPPSPNGAPATFTLRFEGSTPELRDARTGTVLQAAAGKAGEGVVIVGNNAAEVLTIVGDAADNVLTLTGSQPGSGQARLDGFPLVTFSGVDGFVFQGGSGRDVLEIIEDASGLPSFSETAPGAVQNPVFAASSFAALPTSIHMAGDGADDLVLRLRTPHDVVYFAGSEAGRDNSGIVAVAGALNLSFEGLAPLTFVGSGGTLTIDATVTSGVTHLIVSDDANSSTFSGAAGDDFNAVYDATGGTGFEDTKFKGFNGLVVKGGDGAETLEVTDLDDDPALLTVTLDGDNTTGTDAADDILLAHALGTWDGTLTLMGGAGDDDFILGGLAPGTVEGIAAAVVVSPTGDEGGTFDELIVNDQLDAAPGDMVTIDDSTIEGITGEGTATPDITFNGPNLDAITVLLGDESDTVDTISLPATTLTLDGGDPATAPGDVLNYTDTPPGLPVYFTNFETVTGVNFVVNATGDGADDAINGVCETATPGECTLRAALQEANATPGANTIAFDIPGTAPHVISPVLPLPTITEPVIIDGSTQPGNEAVCTAAIPDRPAYAIVLDGSASVGSGLTLTGTISVEAAGKRAAADGSTIKGLNIRNFPGSGINISDSDDNLIVCNFIGTNEDGTAEAPNGFDGVYVTGGSSNQIGGTAPGDGNLLSGNVAANVRLEDASLPPGPPTGDKRAAVSATSNNRVQGNFIGTDKSGTAGLVALPLIEVDPTINPVRVGILIDEGENNLIGGTEEGAENLISGNAFGILIDGLTLLDGPPPGKRTPDASIEATVTRLYAAVERRQSLAAKTGRPAMGERRETKATSGNQVFGNLIGTNATGDAAVANIIGVVVSGASGNQVGGPGAGEGNLISGNLTTPEESAGVVLFHPDAAGNLVQGNLIGTNLAGTAAVPNGFGVTLSSLTAENIVGMGAIYFKAAAPSSPPATPANVISGNANDGIFMIGVSGQIVAGNFIGTDVTGQMDLGNGDNGIEMEEADGTTIGGAAAGEGNLISGNDNNGIKILGSSTGNLIQGNFIGTDLDGTDAIPNDDEGIDLDDGGVTETTIGTPPDVTKRSLKGQAVTGPPATPSNLISGNGDVGIQIADASSVFIYGNFIGPDVTGQLDLGNGDDGIDIEGTTSVVMIGSPLGDLGNLISGNDGDGIDLEDTVTGVKIQANTIGPALDGTEILGHGQEDGIDVEGPPTGLGPTDILIGGLGTGEGNTIAFHTMLGVEISGDGAKDIEIFSNSIHSNASLGIDLSNDGVTPNDEDDPDTGPNELQNYPVLTSALAAGGTVTVEGTLNSIPSTSFILEFFASTEADASGFGEGERPLGTTTVTTDADGDAAFSETFTAVAIGEFITATAAPGTLVEAAPKAASIAGGTSEFSAAVLVVDCFIVTTTADSGDGSLRQAIECANANAGLDTITFDIPGTAPHVIQPMSALPGIQDPLVLDGASQPGNAGVCSNPIPDRPAYAVVLDGTSAGAMADGLLLEPGADGSTVQGLNIRNFNGNGIFLDGPSDNSIFCNFIGTDEDGDAAMGNGAGLITGGGIRVTQNGGVGGAGNLIGTNGDGTNDANEGNLISSSTYDGVSLFQGTSGSVVAGNFIGTDKSGTAALGNVFSGVAVLNTSDNRIGTNSDGTSDTEERNVISGMPGQFGLDGVGIYIAGSAATGNVVAGNYIGTDLTGTEAIPNTQNGIFIDIDASGNVIGMAPLVTGAAAKEQRTGALAAGGNLISGNGGAGVYITNSDGNTVAGNTIGLNADESAALPNGGAGVLVNEANGNQIGSNGDGTGDEDEGNTIASNTGNGVTIQDVMARKTGAAALIAQGNTVLTNAIFDNGGLGIDLGDDGLTANDAGDPDEDANRLQNWPVITNVEDLGGGSYAITYFIDTDPGNADYPFRVEFFEADDDGEEGKTFAGFDTYTESDYSGCGTPPCEKTTTLTFPAAVTTIVATATDGQGGPVSAAAKVAFGGNTSEFSVPMPLVAATKTVSLSGGDDGIAQPGETLTYTVTITNTGSATATGVTFSDPIDSNLDLDCSTVSPAADSCTGGLGGNFSVDLGDLGPGASVVVTFETTVENPLPDGVEQVENLGDITGANFDPVTTDDGNPVVTPVEAAPMLSATKTDAVSGDRVLYTITVSNDGDEAATDVVVMDTVDPNTDLDCDSITPAPDSCTGGPGGSFEVTLGTLDGEPRAAKQQAAATITFEVTILSSTPSSTEFVENQATVDFVAEMSLEQILTDDPDEPGTEDPTRTPIERKADVSLTKTVDEETPDFGTNVVFTIEVTNDGAETTVVVEDPLPDGLVYVSHTASEGSYDPDTGRWQAIALDDGETATLEITARVETTEAVTNTAEVTAASRDDDDSTPNNHDPDEDDQDSASITPVAADLAVFKDLTGVTELDDGRAAFTFEITVTNDGPSDATDVVVTDDLADDVVFVSATASQGAYAEATGTWAVGPLDDGATATLVLVVEADEEADAFNFASVAAAQPDQDLSNNSSADFYGRDPERFPFLSDLSLAKTVDDAAPTVGETVTFTITVTNAGPHAATGVEIIDRLPAGLSFVSAMTEAGTFDETSLVWSLGQLRRDSTVTLTITARVDVAGPLTNVAEVQANNLPDADSVPNNEAAGEDDQAAASLTAVSGKAATSAEQEGGLPTTVELGSAYPNPFNPEAVVPFALPEAMAVRVEVYDVQGRRVAVLAAGTYAAGRHTVVWQAGGHPTGLYLVRLVAGTHIATQRLTLVK